MAVAANNLPLLWSMMLITVIVLAFILFLFNNWARKSQNIIKNYKKNKY
jgi:hypothetical protein